MVSYELLSALAFYSVLAIVIYINRSKFEVIEKIVIAFRTQKPIAFMKNLAKYKRFWKVFSTLSVPISFILMGFVLYMLTSATIDIILQPEAPAAVGLVIPGVRIPGSSVFLPLWYGIISIAVLAIVHEFSHGIVALAEKIPIKSSGFGFLLILPVAFVEPDEKKAAKASRLSRMRMISAGPMSNIALAVILSLVAAYTLAPFLNSLVEFKGIEVVSTVEGLPAQLSGLPDGAIVNGIDNQQVSNITNFAQILSTYSPGDTITLISDKGEFDITLAEHPDNSSLPYMGVSYNQNWNYSEEAVSKYSMPALNILSWFSKLLGWIINLNFAVGLINLLPVWFLDGGQLLTNGLSYIFKNEKTLAKVVNSIFYYSLSLLLLNIVLPLL